MEITELTPGRSYAVLLAGVSRIPLRPLRGDWDGKNMLVHDPDHPLDQTILKQAAVGLDVLGEWEEVAVHPQVQPHWLQGGASGAVHLTWQGYVAHQHAQVLRQRELVIRLAALGIQRDPEPYILRPEQLSNTVRRSLRLNFDELDQLISAAEQGRLTA